MSERARPPAEGFGGLARCATTQRCVPAVLPGVDVTVEQIHTGTTKLDLSVAFLGGSEDLTGMWEFDRDVLSVGDVLAIQRSFHRCLERILDDPSTRLAALTTDERNGDVMHTIGPWTREDSTITIRTGRPALVSAPSAVEAAAWLREVREPLEAALQEHGAVLVRGLPVTSLDAFAAVRDALIAVPAGHEEESTPRSRLADDVFSSTDLPASQAIRPHNEFSYALEFPGRLLFACLRAPATGGATPVCDVRQVLEHLPADLLERFTRHGWQLIRHYDGVAGLSWQTAFGTDDREEVERYCEANAISTSWLGDGRLRTLQRRAAIVRHPKSGDAVWFNHAAFWSEWSLPDDVRSMLRAEYGDALPFNTAFGDGTPLTASETAAINDAYDRAVVRDDWEVGDLLFVDNLLAAHAREAYTGGRQIVVAMGDSVKLAETEPGAVR